MIEAGKRYDALLFDFDGVLADTEPVHWQCWSELIAANTGFNLTWECYLRDCVGTSDRFLAELVERLCGCPANRVMELYPAKKQLFLQRILKQPPIYPETVSFVKSQVSIHMAVVSSSARSEIAPILAAAGVLASFHSTVFSDDVRELKPAPEPYEKAAQLLGARAPLVFEDSDAGMESARAAGFDCIRVPHAKQLPELAYAALGLSQRPFRHFR